MPESFTELVNRELRDFEGYTGDGQGGVGDLPVGDRSTARRPIKNDALRRIMLAQESAVQTAVDAAAEATAAADLASTAMLDVQGATLYAADRAALLANTDTHPVGTIFSTRAEGYGYQVVSSDPDLTTAGGVMLRAIGQVLSPGQFGYVSGQGDCSALLNRMFSRGREFAFDPNEVYKIAAQIDTGARAIFHGGIVTFEITETFGAAAVILRDTQADTVQVRAASGVTSSVPVIVRNGYTNIGTLRIISADQQAAYSGASQSAIRFDETDGQPCYPRIGTIYARGFDRVAWAHSSIDGLSVDWIDAAGCYRGLQTERIPRLRIGGGIVTCDSPNSAPQAGHNALVIHANQASIGDFWSYNAGEHGYRFLAGNAEFGETGGNYSCGNLVAIRPGRCGVKFASGTAEGTPANIENVDIASIYVEDAGTYYDPAPAATSWADDNDHALSLLNCRKVRIGRFITRKNLNNWNGRFGIKLDGVQFLTIESADIADTFGEAIHLDDDWISLDTINMPDTTIRNCGLGATVASIRFNSIQKAARHITIGGYVNGCPGILRITTNGGSFAQESFFNFRHRDLTGDLYTSDTGYANVFTDFTSIGTPLGAVYIGGDATNEDFPIGTVLAATVPGGGSMPNRNATMAPYRHTNGTGFSTNATNSTGAQLKGVWRARGNIGADTCLIERVT